MGGGGDGEGKGEWVMTGARSTRSPASGEGRAEGSDEHEHLCAPFTIQSPCPYASPPHL